MLRILHISDIHISDSNLNETKELIGSLLERLDYISSQQAIDLIIFSGDAINKGGDKNTAGHVKSFADFDEFVVTPILKVLNLNKSRFILTPGNHDIQREKIPRIMELGLQSDLTSEESIEKNRKEVPELFDRCMEYKNYEKEFYHTGDSGFSCNLSMAQSVFNLTVNDTKIGIVSLNTAWRCYDSTNDHKHNVAGKFQIEESLDKLSDCELLIAVSHHHHSLLKNFDDKAIGKLLLEHFSLYFTGHTHSPDADLHVKPTGCLYNFVASGVLSENIKSSTKYKNGFTVIDYDLDNGICCAEYYYQKPNLKFELDTTIGDNGRWQTNFPIGPEAEKNREIQKIYYGIEEQIEEWNNHLLGWDSTDESGQTIRDIFVMPEIKYDEIISPELNTSITNRKISSLEEILRIDGNVLILGVKESGKTLLIDRLILELIDNVNKYNILPVRLQFDYCNNIMLQISNFWRKSRKEVKDILESENVILFIDEIEDDKPQLTKMLINFCSTYPKTRIIATCRRNAGMDISRTLRISPLKFTVLEILNFGAKQVRELTKKWFRQSLGDEEAEEYISTIIDTLSGLNLPPSPFAISMFLSILQRNKASRPKNQSLLTKDYIENLLRRGETEVYARHTFNTQNKINLLVTLAKKMYEKSSEEGIDGLGALEVTTEITQYLKRTGLDMFSQRKILDEILDTSIIIEEFNIYRFRFKCFQEFFLALAMTMDNDFKSKLSDDYLSHSNEMIFFTGLQTHNKDILVKIITDLSNEFQEIDELVKDKFNNNIDNVFNYTKSLISELEDDGMALLLPEKQTEEDKIHLEDKKLQISETDQTKRNPQIMHRQIQRIIHLGDRLVLTMNVLRNVEDLQDIKLKSSAYRCIIKKTIVYACIYSMLARVVLTHMQEEEDPDKEQIQQIYMSLMYLPALNVDLIFQNLGSMKLTTIIKSKIDKDKVEAGISEFEKFISVFLYAQIKGKDFLKELRHFCDRYQRAYIADSIMMKLQEYYHTSHIKNDNDVQNLIADVYIKEKSNHDPKSKLDKENVIRQLKSSKKHSGYDHR